MSLIRRPDFHPVFHSLYHAVPTDTTTLPGPPETSFFQPLKLPIRPEGLDDGETNIVRCCENQSLSHSRPRREYGHVPHLDNHSNNEKERIPSPDVTNTQHHHVATSAQCRDILWTRSSRTLSLEAHEMPNTEPLMLLPAIKSSSDSLPYLKSHDSQIPLEVSWVLAVEFPCNVLNTSFCCSFDASSMLNLAMECVEEAGFLKRFKGVSFKAGTSISSCLSLAPSLLSSSILGHSLDDSVLSQVFQDHSFR